MGALYGRQIFVEVGLSDRTRRIASGLLIFVLVLAGVYAGNLWLFHGWAANVSDTRPDWHRVWSIRFFVAMCACFAAAALWATRRRWLGRFRPSQ
jgi:cytochrome bd-type quinol oxidase subunit 2